MATPKMLQSLLALALLSSLASSTPLWLRPEPSANDLKPRAYEDYALPTGLKPTAYDITLYPYLDNAPIGKTDFTFDGIVKISIDVKEANINVIQMHAFDVTIEDKSMIKVTDSSGTVVVVTDFTMTDKTDDRHFLHINLETPLINGQKYNVEITYVGILNDDLDGFYRSKYLDINGAEKWMAVTQFEQNGARRAFPCFDEPIWKAKFTIHIAHAPEYDNVLSNMDQDGDEQPITGIPGLETWMMVHFKQSAADMSSYLVAFTVSNFKSIVNADDPRYKLWARPGAENQGHYANDLAPKIVHYMEGFTGHVYTFPKVDQIGIPDFSAGAMENWGLITYRESSLLFEQGVSTSNNRQRIEAVVAHELAHQWFGNIVSPTWWSHIWLNEGFATYFEYHALATVQDTWQLVNQFIYQEMHTVLQTDALTSTHPLWTEVDSPASSSAAFDNIAYNKGGCMVRFMISLMGEENFKEGINKYLTAMEFSNAEPDNLWAGLEGSVPAGVLPPGVDFKTVMDTWVKQAGYPVVTVTRDYNLNTAVAKQERFLTSQGTEPSEEKWWVSLSFTAKGGLSFSNIWLAPTADLALSLPASKDSWVVFNTQQVGYYRVNYDATNWGLLASALNDHSEMSKIHVVNRGQLVDDALALARAGLLDYDLALDTTEYLGHETEYHPWAVALTAMGYLNDRLNYEEASRSPFQWYMLDKLGPAYSLVNGFTVTEDDSHVMRLKRSLILKWACELGMKECNTEAASLFKEWQANPEVNPIAPDLKSVVYCAGMREGGQAEYDFLFAQYEASSNVATEQSLILTALGCASDTKLLEDYLAESILDTGRIRRQDARSVHSSVYNNYLGVDIALHFIIDNWLTCVDVYGGPNNVGRAFTGVAGKSNTEEQREELNALYEQEDNPESLMDRTLHKTLLGAIASVDETLAWHTQHKTHVVAYFKSRMAVNGAGLSTISPLLLVVTVALSALFAKL